MRGLNLKSGDQVRDLFSNSSGQNFEGDYGYVVESLGNGIVWVLWTHQSCRLPYPKPWSSRVNESDLWSTGKVYSNQYPTN